MFVQSKAVAQQIIGRYQKLVVMSLGAYAHVQHNVSSMPPASTTTTHMRNSIRGKWRDVMDAFQVQAMDADERLHYADALEETFGRIPEAAQHARYFVRHTWKVSALSSKTGRPVPKPWRPLNVICVAVLPDSANGELSDVVAESFDLQHCMVSLQVTQDGNFDYGMNAATYRCVQQKKLILRPTAFRGRTVDDAIRLQLVRVLKYLKRGFTW